MPIKEYPTGPIVQDIKQIKQSISKPPTVTNTECAAISCLETQPPKPAAGMVRAVLAKGLSYSSRRYFLKLSVWLRAGLVGATNFCTDEEELGYLVTTDCRNVFWSAKMIPSSMTQLALLAVVNNDAKCKAKHVPQVSALQQCEHCTMTRMVMDYYITYES